MTLSKALLATASGTIIAATAFGMAGESYCTYDGPDIMTYKVADSFGSFDMEYYGSSGDIGGFAVASTSGNPGNMVAQWTGNSGSKSPVIAQNAFRLKNGTLEMIGLSWLKHSFCAVSEAMCSCQSTSCSTLGIGCADTYWAGLNADADAPRSEINATNGVYDYPFVQSPCGSSSVRGKLQILDEYRNPAQNPDARYFIEVQYVAPDSDESWGPDEYDFNNQYNNSSYREVNFNSATSTSSAGPTIVMTPGIYAWETYGGATVRVLWTPEADSETGLMHLGYKVTDNGDGTWHYEYAVHNQNSHRSAGSFSVPVSDCVTLTNIEFHDVEYHSCEMVEDTDWTVEVADGYITWYTESEEQNEWANAVRWGTMYNFRFDADYPPSNTTAMIGFWRSGSGDSIEASTQGPIPNCEGECQGDFDNNGTRDVNDVLHIIAHWGGSGGDIDGNGTTDVDDLLILLGFYGVDC